ncbi:hypothetical protein AB0D34_07875 [Streptomyces sp. NPDC048420]|uniref:hypothetical protein n=1 Tax=Streptomyces sp. NPDC048420 TaxID=3155755 RepID=UPI003412482E
MTYITAAFPRFIVVFGPCRRREVKGLLDLVLEDLMIPPKTSLPTIIPEGRFGQLVELITASTGLNGQAAERLVDGLLDRLGLYGPTPERVHDACSAMFFNAEADEYVDEGRLWSNFCGALTLCNQPGLDGPSSLADRPVWDPARMDFDLAQTALARCGLV